METGITKEIVKKWIQALTEVNKYAKENGIKSRFLIKCNFTEKDIDAEFNCVVYDSEHKFVVEINGKRRYFNFGESSFEKISTLSLDGMKDLYKQSIIKRIQTSRESAFKQMVDAQHIISYTDDHLSVLNEIDNHKNLD